MEKTMSLAKDIRNTTPAPYTGGDVITASRWLYWSGDIKVRVPSGVVAVITDDNFYFPHYPGVFRRSHIPHLIAKGYLCNYVAKAA